MAVMTKKMTNERRNNITNVSSTPLGTKQAVSRLPHVRTWETILNILYPTGFGSWRKAIIESMIQEITQEIPRV